MSGRWIELYKLKKKKQPKTGCFTFIIHYLLSLALAFLPPIWKFLVSANFVEQPQFFSCHHHLLPLPTMASVHEALPSDQESSCEESQGRIHQTWTKKNKNRSVNISYSSLGWSIIISNINQAWGTSELYWHKVVAIQTSSQCSKVHTIMTEGQYSTVGLEQVRPFIAYYMELRPLTCLFWFCQLSQTKIQIHGL